MAFSKKVKNKLKTEYNNECGFCRYNEHPEILEAAHIVKHSENPDAIDVICGVLLCPNCHSVQDKGLFKDEDYKRFLEKGKYKRWIVD